VVKTEDQRAIFRGKVVHAGYISNYAYGYAVAATNYYKSMADFGAFGAGEIDHKYTPDDKDMPYAHEGYEAFWADHPNLKRGWMQQ
jgi:hypothetical protein